MLDKVKDIVYNDEDEVKTKLILSVLVNWNLLDLVDENGYDGLADRSVSLKGLIKIVPYKEKYKWKFHSPYNIGVTKD